MVGGGGHDQKTGGVVALILYPVGEHFQPVNFACKRAGQRGSFRNGRLGYLTRRSGGVGAGDALDAMRLQKATALAQQHGVAHGLPDVVQRRAGHRQKGNAHPHERLAYDVQPAARQQVVNVSHAPECRIFHRQHRKACCAAAHCLDRLLKAAAGQDGCAGICLAAGLMGIGSGLSLKGNGLRHGLISLG